MTKNKYTYLFDPERVKQKRESMGMSQEALAIKSGVSLGYVSLIENGIRTPTANIIGSIAHSLKVDINYFYDFVKKD